MKTLREIAEVKKMNKREFLEKLKKELFRLPAEEAEAAMEYYREYFDEAGPENEEKVAESLGSPKRVAAQIKADYAAKLLESEEKTSTKKGLSAVWWIIIGICSAPLSIPLAICAIVIVIVVFAVLISCIIGIFTAIVAFIAGSIGVFGLGILAVPAAFSTALMFTGAGLAGISLMTAAGVGAAIGVRALARAFAKTVRMKNEKSKEKRVIREAEQQRWKYIQEPEAFDDTWKSGALRENNIADKESNEK